MPFITLTSTRFLRYGAPHVKSTLGRTSLTLFFDMAQPPTLSALPADILQLVVDNITRPSDLKSLAQVDQVWNQHASASLYKDTYINLGVLPASSSFFQANHPCHPYVFGLHFYEKGDGPSNAQRCTVAQAALALIPNDRLRRLTFPLHMVVSKGILREMYLHQSAIKTLAIGLCNGALMALYDDEGEDIVDWLCDLEDLTIPNAFVADADRFDLICWNHTMRYQTALSSLELAPTVATLPPSPTVNARVLFDNLFWINNDDQQPLKLETLKLRGFDFDQSIAAIHRAFDFSNLTTLAVTNMESSTAFLNALAAPLRRQSRRRLPPKLKNLHLSTVDRTDAAALTAVLLACTDLRELQIKSVGRYGVEPTRASITKHAATLRVSGFGVEIESNNNTGNVYVLSQAMFSTITNHLVRLEELTVNLGHPTISTGLQGNGSTRSVMRRCMRLARCCPSLRALRLLKWPKFPASVDDDVVHYAGLPLDSASVAALRTAVFKDTQILAKRMFQVHTRAPNRPFGAKALRVLMIAAPSWPCHVDHVPRPGPSPYIEYDVESIPSVIYARKDLVDLDGVRTTVAVKASEMDLEYDDRKYGIIDY